MKKLLALLFSILISFNSYGEWIRIIASEGGNDTFYVNTNSIKKNNGYVYWWEMRDSLKPDKFGDMSDKTYGQVDCDSMRYQYLQMTFFKHSMGEGEGETHTPESGWRYAPPDSVGETLLDFVCDYVN